MYPVWASSCKRLLIQSIGQVFLRFRTNIKKQLSKIKHYVRKEHLVFLVRVGGGGGGNCPEAPLAIYAPAVYGPGQSFWCFFHLILFNWIVNSIRSCKSYSTHTLQLNPYEMSTLGEMDSGGIKRAGPSIEIRTMESSHRDFDYWPSIALNSCGCLIGGKINYKDSFYPRTIAQWTISQQNV